MNVLVLNQQESVISNLNIEIIKTLRGSFSPEEIISTFNNFFFARMILDITALKKSDDIVTYQKLSIGLPIDKVILLIPPTSTVAKNYFLSKLISMGYYNFTTNRDGVAYLLDKPNTYDDVAYLHQIGAAPSSLTPDLDGGKSLGVTGIKTIGFKNVTDSAGSSTLIYMIKKELEENYGLSILAIEVDKRDFAFFREENMVSTTSDSLATELMKAKNFNYILIDLNDYDDNICDEMLYLIEPTVIKLNKLMLKDKTIFSKLKDKKIIINKSTFSEEDIKEFAKEAGVPIFYVLPPLNDRERSQELNDLLINLELIDE